METSTSRLIALLSGIAMVLAIYIGVTAFKGQRLDLTAESLYTVSAGSKALMGKLDSPVKLRLYYSKTAANQGTEGLRTFNNYFTYVTEVLKQLAEHSRNNITLHIIDPRPDTPEEEDAVGYGLRKFNLTQSESYFFGLVAENESGTEKIIEFFDPAQKDKLEYELTKLIYTVQHPQKKTIGIMSALPVVAEDLSPYMAQIMQLQGKPVGKSWLMAQLLQELYTVKKLEPSLDKITGVDLLIIVHPSGFAERTLFAIDQYVLEGGNALVFVDPKPFVAARAQPGQPPQQGASPDPAFAKLMASWGIAAVPGRLVADRYLSPTGQFSPDQPATTLLALLNCTEQCTAAYRDPITAGLGELNLVYPGELTILPPADGKPPADGSPNAKVTTLLATTDKGNSYTASDSDLQQPMNLLAKFKDGDSAKILGVKVTGTFRSAFPKGITITEPDQTQASPALDSEPSTDSKPAGKTVQKTGLAKSTKPAAIVVFSDVDMIHDSMAFKNSFLGPVVAGDNSTLFLNATESLTGNDDLLAVRTKSRTRRSFTVIDTIEREAEAKTADKVSQINTQITTFEQELAALGAGATEGNIALLQNQGLAKKKQLMKTIAGLKKELRTVKREGREQIEAIGDRLRLLNTLAVPLLVILVGTFHLYRRQRKARGIAKDPAHSSATSPKPMEVQA